MSYEPRIVGFLCNWCSYTGADLAGTSRIQYPPNIRVIRVMCSARVDPTFVMHAFSKGAVDVSDAVTVLQALFGGGGELPSPGAESCGGDPSEDPLPDCTSRQCP